MIKNWQSQFEKLFDSSTEILNLQEQKKEFEVLNNIQTLSHISYHVSQVATPTQWKSFLSILNNYFEVVSHLKLNKKNQLCSLADLYAYSIEVPTAKIQKEIRLPDSKINSVLTTDGLKMLNKFQLDYLVEEKKSKGFLFRVSDTDYVLVVTQTAEPWLKLKVEKLFETLLRIDFTATVISSTQL